MNDQVNRNNNTASTTTSIKKTKIANCEGSNDININCLLCGCNSSNEYEKTATSNYYNDHENSIIPYLELPNENNSFSNIVVPSNTEEVNWNNVNNTDVNANMSYANSNKMLKSLYSNESFSFKYNYLINKFI